ncbi:MAG: archaeosortase/exosortase family protein [Prochlorococcaceae cyanobacterium]
MIKPFSEAWRRRCWLLIAALVAAGSISRAWFSQAAEIAVMVTLVWGGALCCLEERLATLRPRPDGASFTLGVVLLVAAQWRQERLLDTQPIMLLLPLLQGLGLVLLLGPVRHWRRWAEPLLALALLALPRLLQAVVSMELLSRITARLCQGLLLSFGVDAALEGTLLRVPGGAVSVSGTCGGFLMVAQLVVVGGLFALVFPLAAGRRRWLAMVAVMAVAPLFAVAANTLRITLLALINAFSGSPGRWWFDLLHEGMGSQLFSLLAVLLFAPAYFSLQDHLLARQRR